MEQNVGLVGYGIMGAAMATKLLDGGYEVFVCDPSPTAADRAGQAGCTVFAKPREIAARAAIVLISVPRPEHVTEVVCGHDGLLAGAREGSLIVDTSTVDPDTTRRNAEAAAGVGVGYLDCPVLGRPSACGNRTLPAGGDPRHLATAAPVLETFAAKIIHIGHSGEGNLVKVLNCLLFGAINSITCEVFALGKLLGMEPERLYGTLAESCAGTVSPLFREIGAKIVADDFTPYFTVENLHKDVALGIALARQAGITLEFSEAGQHITELAMDAGHGQQDTAAVVRVLERIYDTTTKESV